MNNKTPYALLVVASVLGLSTFTILLGVQLMNSTTKSDGSNIIGLTLPASLLGKAVNLTEAHRIATFQFNVPAFLPEGTTLGKVFISNNGEVVSLFYNNANLPDAKAFGGSLPVPAQLVIYIEASASNPVNQMVSGSVPPIVVQVQSPNGDISTVETIPQQPVGSILTTCAVNGFGRDHSGNEPGLVVWWKNGVFYLVTAKLPLPTLLLIANSMC